jgi:hypothetical protein
MMIDFGLQVELVAILAGAAFLAGFVDAIAGGGGLITVPALLLAGLPPVAAIATNKLQGTFGVAAAALTFWRAGRIEPALARPLFLAALTGGVLGAGLAHLAPAAFLRLAIPVILVAIALYVLRAPKLGDADAAPRLAIRPFALSFGVGIGLYDGIFGPGAGTFYLLALILAAGHGMMRAIAHTKLMNFASNIGALAFFLAAGHVLVALGLLMGASAAAGAHLGARTTLRHGGRLVRPLVVIVSIAMAVRLMLDPAHPLGAWLRNAG